MRITILGGGSVALANAAMLAERGHEITMWSAVAEEVEGIRAAGGVTYDGVLSGRARVLAEPEAARAVRNAEALVIAAPAFAHHPVMTAIAPYVRDGQPTLVHPVTGGSSLFLARLLDRRGVRAPIVDMSTSLLTCRKTGPASVHVFALKALVDIAAVPATATERALGTCEEVYGARFAAQRNVLTISLDNHNPIYHVPPFLCNLSRVEKAEDWIIWDNITPAVARLVKALDDERMAVMDRYGLPGQTVEDYFHRSFGVAKGELRDMFPEVSAKLKGPLGPREVRHRFVLEDVPYALGFFRLLGRIGGVSMPLTEALVTVTAAIYGAQVAAENEIVGGLGLSSMTVEQILELAATGRGPRA